MSDARGQSQRALCTASMASPSPCNWPVTRKIDSTIHLASSQRNPSIFLSFRAGSSKRPRLTTFSLSGDTPPPPHIASAANKGLKKTADLDNSSFQPITLSVESDTRFLWRPATFKSFLGTRSSWRRTLFASKKVRSIILLNVITIVYGKQAFQLLGICLVTENILLYSEAIFLYFLSCFMQNKKFFSFFVSVR